MKKFLLVLLLAILGSFGLYAQVTLEDFEGGTADLPWNGLNGTYNGAIANPDQSGINTSDWVGSYTNNGTFDFCFALANQGPATFDLSEYNQIKMKVWSPTAPCQVLFKFEGGGHNVEKFQDITVANQWVEYTFDLSGGAAFTGLTTALVSFNPFVLGDNATYYFDDIRPEKAGVCYETFEGVQALPWFAFDGFYAGAVANPGPNSVNSSATCGEYTKSNASSYSLLIADTGTPFDLSVNNQFKLKVYTSAPTQVLLKLEGSGGFVEKTKNIAVANAWQEYTFDFSSAAANTGLTKAILFFDPGVETSGDTYYFDDLCAVPNACAGATANPDVLDDFECNRTATYAGDWSALSVVKNPFPNGDNNSSKVGKWDDPSGPNTAWSNFNIDYQNAIDLSVRNQFSLKLYAPKTGNLLLKLEGGPTPKEYSFPVTELNQWVTYTADFSAQVNQGHKKLVVFINAGVDGDPGDVYYVDDIQLTAPTVAPPLEDFEGGVHLGWQPLDQNNVLHGNFSAPTANSNPNSVNSSAEVGCYTLGSSAFSTLQAFSLTSFDLSVYPQFNLDVLSPATGGTVVLQLSSPTQGNKQAEAEITTPGQWETLGFDFSAFSAITDFAEVRVVFNPGTAAPGQSWCIDNLRQSAVNVDPCAGEVPVPNIVDDFECQRNYTQIYYGGSDISVVNNPHLAVENGSLKVGKYVDPVGQPWAGLGFEFPAAIDLSVFSQMEVQVYSPVAGVPCLLKLEGGTQIEKWDTITEANKWVKLKVDFSGALGSGNTKFVIFFNAGNDQAGGETYFIDNIKFARPGYNGCIDDHETAGTTLSNFTYFANGHLEDSGYQFEVVDNPNAAGINTSSTVGKFIKASDGQPWAGMYADLDAPIDWKGVKQVKAKVHMDHIGNFAVKLEGDAVNNFYIELPVANSATNTWEELTYNFATVPDNSEFKRLTVFFDLGIDATGQDVTSYFDDIVIGDGQCGSVGLFNPLPIEPMVISPNPVSDMLTVENFRDINRMEVYNLLGQRVANISTGGDLRVSIDVSRFPAGVYTIVGYNQNGAVNGNAKFVKQ